MLAHFEAGLDWVTARLVGAVLTPTGPVFASAIVGRTDVPARLRPLLRVESGLNDGLALPVVLVLICAASRRKELLCGGVVRAEGFASVVYGLLVLHSGIPEASRRFELVAVCIGLSIVAHKSTDVAHRPDLRCRAVRRRSRREAALAVSEHKECQAAEPCGG